MNDNPIPNATLDVLDALRERVHLLDADIARHVRSVEVTTACRDELVEMIATLSRKSRTRSKPRTAAPAAPPVTLAGALVSLGTAVAANDAEVPEAA